MATSDAPFDLGRRSAVEVFKDADCPGAVRVLDRQPTSLASGYGVAVRAGAPKPDDQLAFDALKQTLLKSAIHCLRCPASAAGAQVLRVFERLGHRRGDESQDQGRSPRPQRSLRRSPTARPSSGCFSSTC